MRISDWSSDVCSSDLGEGGEHQVAGVGMALGHRKLVAVLGDFADAADVGEVDAGVDALGEEIEAQRHQVDVAGALAVAEQGALDAVGAGHDAELGRRHAGRSEEHTSELQSLMRISSAVFCLKK